MNNKILIADDSLFMRMVLKDTLGKIPLMNQYEIIEADTGASTIEQFKAQKPVLTLLDIIMPEGEEEGLRALKEIKKLDPEAKVIMVTAVGQNVIIEKCKKFGADHYILKPFDEEQIIDTVGKYLNLK